MIRPVLTVIGGMYDQVERRAVFERANPGVVFDGTRSATLPVGGVPRRVLADGLERLLDALQELADAEAERLAIEAEFEGWAVSLSALGRWYAQRAEPWKGFRPILGAECPADLRRLVAAFGI